MSSYRLGLNPYKLGRDDIEPNQGRLILMNHPKFVSYPPFPKNDPPPPLNMHVLYVHVHVIVEGSNFVHIRNLHRGVLEVGVSTISCEARALGVTQSRRMQPAPRRARLEIHTPLSSQVPPDVLRDYQE